MEIKVNIILMFDVPTTPVSNSYPFPGSPFFNVDGSEEYHLSFFTLISIPWSLRGSCNIEKGGPGAKARNH